MDTQDMTEQPFPVNLDFELTATTEEGERFVLLAEKHAEQFALRAGEHDLKGTFPFENFKEMQQSRFMAGAVPSEYGGLGVRSFHDIMVGMSRLARGDASTAIAANMHIAGASALSRLLDRSKADGDTQMAGVLDGLLSQVGAGTLVMCFPMTERGTDLISPQMEATPTDGGYLLNGRKIFGTISPVAQLFFPNVRLPKPDGGYYNATALVSRDAPGLTVEDNWDALGMRASGSHDITFTDCFIPSEQLFSIRDNYAKIGQGPLHFRLTGDLPLIATFVGVAEAAKDCAVKAAGQRKGPKKKRLADRIPIQQLVAEIEIDLSTCRAMVERLGRLADQFMSRIERSESDFSASNALMKELQCMKYVVNRKAIDIVDRSMTVTGGAAYMSKHPLARLYRDVRAGPFMQPFAPYEALEYIGKVALGLSPALDR
jgi:alkylation response protein AidB-like acyl-CoA dehydrogenase